MRLICILLVFSIIGCGESPVDKQIRETKKLIEELQKIIKQNQHDLDELDKIIKDNQK